MNVRRTSSAECTPYDIAIIGAGVVGSAIARTLSRSRLSVAVLEKGWDVGAAASGRNSGVIHAGINYRPGTLRARLCMEGRKILTTWADELAVPYAICGKLVVARKTDEVGELEHLKEQGEANGVPDLRLVSEREALRLQPGIACVAALHVPTSGIVSPYALTIAIAEDAAVNGARFFLGCELRDVSVEQDAFVLRTTADTIRSRWLINAAGIGAGRVARLLDPQAPSLYPCVGEYLILDKRAGAALRRSVYPVPRGDGAGLGVHITPTTEGNVLLGPSSEYVEDPETTATTRKMTDRLYAEACALWPELGEHQVIGAYAGVRAKRTPPDVGGFDDFLIRRSPAHPRAIDLLGIESPGLTAAPAIAAYVVDEIRRGGERLEPKPKSEIRRKTWMPRFDDLAESEKRRVVADDPEHGDIVCRCEGVTKRELLRALDNPLGVRTLSGIKLRCRATMGRCNGGYCLPRIVEILRAECGWRPDDFRLRGMESPAFAGDLIEEATDASRH